MPSITLTDPVAGTTVASGLIATNNANLRTLLNAGLDTANLKGSPPLTTNDPPIWNGANFVRPSGVASASTFLRGDGSWAVPGAATTTSAWSGGPPGSPADKDIWIATDVAGTGHRWMFQYDAAWGTDSFKWKFIGGPPVGTQAATAIPGTSVWTSLATITLARAGIYQPTGYIEATGNAGALATYLLGFGGNNVQLIQGAATTSPASLQFSLAGGYPTGITIAAAQVVNLFAWANAAPTGQAEWLSVVPSRII